MSKEKLIAKFKNTFGHLEKEGLEVLGIINLLGDEVFYVIHPLVFDGRVLPTAFHGYPLRSGFSDEEFPPHFYNEETEEYLFSPERFTAYAQENLASIQQKLGTSSLEETLDAICFGNFKEFEDSYASINN